MAAWLGVVLSLPGESRRERVCFIADFIINERFIGCKRLCLQYSVVFLPVFSFYLPESMGFLTG